MSALTQSTIVTLALLSTFAALVTVHVAIVYGLGRRRRAAHGVAALLIPPTAPYWALKSGMRARAVAWIACAVVYGVALLLAR